MAQKPFPHLAEAVSVSLPCKLCNESAALAGFADFSRDVYDYNRQRGIISGVAVPYYRCPACDFGFTDRFDAWSDADFVDHIYNSEYHLFDPRYADARPRKTAGIVCDVFPDRAHSVLDYGAGNGLTAELLREAGFGPVESYDPHHGNTVRPDGKTFDIVICIEVVEHSTAPLAIFDELNRYCAPDGVILFSTKDFSTVKGHWMDDGYVAPRNGHVSLFAKRSFHLIAQRLGRVYHGLDKYRHLLMPVETE